MPAVLPQAASTRRRLIFHDLVAFAVLLAVTGALFAVTLLLFKSFEQHRLVLANRWSDRGKQALAQNQPEAAVFDLRTSLSYTVDTNDARDRQLFLADALARAGHVEEATSYFENLWDARPGDGFINLQLARLARLRHEDSSALDYYHSSVSGTWEGDGLARRREVRFEMIDLLIAEHRVADAQQELSIIVANAPDDPQIDLALAQRLQAIGDPAAAIFYQKAVEPMHPVILQRRREGKHGR